MQEYLVCSYSRTITGWLSNRFPGTVSLDSSGATNDEIVSVLQLLLPSVEFYSTTQHHFNMHDRIGLLTGLKSKKDQLHWLLEVFAGSDLPEAIKDELYGQLKIFIKWKPDHEEIRKLALHFPFDKKLPAEQTIKRVDASRISRQKINPSVKLTNEQRSLVLDAMKVSLALKCRETDPVTYADPNELGLFNMGRGLQIALVGMQKQKRLSLENYIGYMVFKNGNPIAYGGAWIWGQRCRIGINIYPEFRKGASSWLFAQVLRLYYQYFNARLFIVRANQFGEGNHDGLKSGAFWFYYKLGFRPASKELRELARDEWDKISANKRYRCSLNTLRKFIASPLQWKAGKTSFAFVDAETISRKISELINTVYDGSRIKAMQAIKIQLHHKLNPLDWPKEFRSGNPNIKSWPLIINMLSDFSNWPAPDKTHLFDLLRLKLEGNERDHIIGMQSFRMFWHSLPNS